MRCSSCDFENAAGKKFCIRCGATLGLLCSKCGSENPPEANFCGDCGCALSKLASTSRLAERAVAPIVVEHDEVPQGERRHLTVLFSDLVGSTEISARLDPEEFREVVAEYHAAAAEAIKAFGGHVAKYLGDGVMAYFGWPEAHDNDAERAARAGLATIDAVGNLKDRDKKPRHSGLSVRVGIDSGIVVIGKGGSSDSEIFGDAANVAARIQAAADSDTVVVTAATHRLISGLFVTEERGAQYLKGIAKPVYLYRVVRLSSARGRLAASAARGLTPFIGREDELRLLLDR
jgi:class 3 adenylate cyclase/ribosomal protein L40E